MERTETGWKILELEGERGNGFIKSETKAVGGSADGRADVLPAGHERPGGFHRSGSGQDGRGAGRTGGCKGAAGAGSVSGSGGRQRGGSDAGTAWGRRSGPGRRRRTGSDRRWRTGSNAGTTSGGRFGAAASDQLQRFFPSPGMDGYKAGQYAASGPRRQLGDGFEGEPDQYPRRGAGGRALSGEFKRFRLARLG